MPPIPSHRTVLELPCTHALNLCDVAGTSPDALATPAQVVETLCRQTARDAEVGSFDRVYVGSYLCDRMFLSLSGEFLRAARDLACSMGAALTLVAPVFGQRAADAGLARVKELLSPATDHAERLPFTELVVNDQALAQHMGAWLEQVYPDIAKRPRLVRGRLMARCARDPRYGAPAAPQPVPLDARAADLERAAWHPCLMEVDPFAPLIDASPWKARCRWRSTCHTPCSPRATSARRPPSACRSAGRSGPTRPAGGSAWAASTSSSAPGCRWDPGCT